MWSKFNKILDRAESRLALFTWFGGSATMGVVTGWISTYSEWISSFGAVAWIFSGLLAALLFSVIFALWSWVRLQMTKNNAVTKWKEQVDQVDPMADTYSKKRIKISDIVDPITNSIAKKTFTDCDLVGPMNLVISHNCHFNKIAFVNCDVVPLKNDVLLYNVVALMDVDVIHGRIANCTLFIHESSLNDFRRMGVNFTSLAIDEIQPNQ